MNNEEAKIQVQIIKLLQSEKIYFFAVNNEAHGRNAKQQMQLMSMGLRPGVSDLIVFPNYGNIIFVEVKTPTGKQSDSQKRFQARVEALGFQYHIVRSVDDVRNVIANYNK